MSRPDPQRTLERVRERILTGWCQDDHARSERGTTSPWSADATQWSLRGALVASTSQVCELQPLRRLLVRCAGLETQCVGLRCHCLDDHLGSWERCRSRTRADVLWLIALAIQALPDSPEAAHIIARWIEAGQK